MTMIFLQKNTKFWKLQPNSDSFFNYELRDF